MTQPGRRSTEARSVVNVSGPRERLKPPPELTGTRREIFLDLISAVPPEAFRPSDLPLLCAYARAYADEIEAAERKQVEGAVVDGKRSPWDAVQRDAAKSMGTLAGLLRLTPRARKPWSEPNSSRNTSPVSAYERIRMELDDRDRREHDD